MTSIPIKIKIAVVGKNGVGKSGEFLMTDDDPIENTKFQRWQFATWPNAL